MEPQCFLPSRDQILIQGVPHSHPYEHSLKSANQIFTCSSLLVLLPVTWMKTLSFTSQSVLEHRIPAEDYDCTPTGTVEEKIHFYKQILLLLLFVIGPGLRFIDQLGG